jgi:hypothetical protein
MNMRKVREETFFSLLFILSQDKTKFAKYENGVIRVEEITMLESQNRQYTYLRIVGSCELD